MAAISPEGSHLLLLMSNEVCLHLSQCNVMETQSVSTPHTQLFSCHASRQGWWDMHPTVPRHMQVLTCHMRMHTRSGDGLQLLGLLQLQPRAGPKAGPSERRNQMQLQVSIHGPARCCPAAILPLQEKNIMWRGKEDHDRLVTQCSFVERWLAKVACIYSCHQKSAHPNDPASAES